MIKSMLPGLIFVRYGSFTLYPMTAGFDADDLDRNVSGL